MADDNTLAHYEILAPLGRGGMGEVHRARDTKLGREVALKLLPADFASDPERLARFRRESKVLASLQHPNIAGIFGIEEDQNQVFLVMELAEGSDLSGRIAKGPVPEEEVLEIAGQLAAGLEEAHEKGVVHRDLKPANIKLGSDGKVKILDFGLARAFAGETAGEEQLENSPTITAAMSQGGVILGTAAYMSPEQARGRKVDRRADIWAFGTVLVEMLTGRRLFEGETISDTLAAVLRADIDWDQLPEDTSPGLRRLLERCLERDPLRRLRDIGEARVFLEDGVKDSSLLASTSSSSIADSANSVIETRRPARAGWFAALAMAVVAAVFGGMVLARNPQQTLSRTTLGLSETETINMTGGSAWASVQFSPDGRTVAYIGGHPGQIYLRDIDSFESRMLPGTEGARLPTFSPDGRWIAYRANAALWKVAVSGGAPIQITDIGTGPGLAWGNGELYFPRTAGGGLWAIPENGGEARPISALDDTRDETSHRWPKVLPDGRHVLFTIKTARITTFDDAWVGLLSLDTGEVTVLQEGGTNPHYVPTGHLVYGRDSKLLAVPFDLKTLSIQGTPTPVLEGVKVSDIAGCVHFAVSPQGHLAYVPPPDDFLDIQIVWLDPSGVVRPTEFDPARGLEATPDPTGKWFAAAVVAANDKIWVYDLERSTSSRITSTPGNDRFPVWSPDGTRIVYSNDGDGSRDLYMVSADGSGSAEIILDSDFTDVASSWSPDGSRVLFTRTDSNGGLDIWEVNMEGKAKPFLQSPHNERGAEFSPDGKWVAYSSDSSGNLEVFVRSSSGSGSPTRVSRSGGGRPAWSRDGTQLFFVSDERLMVVSIDGSAGIQVGDPQDLFPLEMGMQGLANKIVPTVDGTRFLGSRFNLEAKQTQIRVVFEWTEQLKGL